MIKTETVLTATPVVLKVLPEDYSLHDHVGNVVKGLDEIAAAYGRYTLDNIATALPVATHDESQHELIMAECTTKIAGAIRQSLNAIKTYVIPSCDKIEKAIKSVGGEHTTEDLMFAKLYLDFVHIGNEFFESPVFPDAPDAGYGSDVLYNVENITKLGIWPELSYSDILDYIPEANNYPELVGALSDSDAVQQAWKALGKPSYWLGTVGSSLNAKNVEVVNHLKPLIVLTLLVNKFASMEDPAKGVTDISLEEYRAKMNSTKRFLNTVLYYTRRRLGLALAGGIVTIKNDLKFEECTDYKSQFFGTHVLNGGCTVVYNDSIAEYFAHSPTYSLSEIAVGMLLSDAKGMRPKAVGFLANVPFYDGVVKTYIKDLSIAVNRNIDVSSKKAITHAIGELANSPLWAEYLSQEGKYKNLGYRLEDLLKEHGGIIDMLCVPGINKRIRCGELCVANTEASVVFAKAIGAPIAAEILRKNISSEHLSIERQRKVMAKAITHYIVNMLTK